MLAGAGNLLNRSPDPRLAAGLVSVEFGEGVAKLVLALAPPADAHTRDFAAPLDLWRPPADIDDTFTLNRATVMLVTEAWGTDEISSRQYARS